MPSVSGQSIVVVKGWLVVNVVSGADPDGVDFVEGVVEATDAVAFVDSPVNGVVCVDSADPCVEPVLVELIVNVGVCPLTVIGVPVLVTIVVAVLGVKHPITDIVTPVGGCSPMVTNVIVIVLPSFNGVIGKLSTVFVPFADVR